MEHHNGKLIRTLSDGDEHVQAVAISPDNKWLICGGRDKPMMGEFLQNFFGDSHYNKGVSMRLWDIQFGNLLQTFSKHANDVNDVAYSTDGNWIASASSDKTVIVWKFQPPSVFRKSPFQSSTSRPSVSDQRQNKNY